MNVFKSEIDRAIEAENSAIRRVIDIIYELHRKKAKKKKRPMLSPRTLEDTIREEFDFMEVKCRDCQKWLSRKEFTKDSSRRFKVYPYCSYCRSIRDKEHRERNREAIRKCAREYAKRKRAKDREIRKQNEQVMAGRTSRRT